MSGPREVVTLQLGPYAGSAGAHWWGLQEASLDSVDRKPDEGVQHDVLFRAGKTLQGQETYTPRLIVMDLKGSLTSLKQEGCLYQDLKTNTSVAWKGSLTTHQEEPCPKNPFLQDLSRSESGRSSNGDFAPRTLPGGRRPLLRRQDEASKASSTGRTMHTWSDFLRTHLHPRSILTIHQYNHDGESDRLEAFGQGEKLLQDPTILEELEDRLHFYVEECDYLQVCTVAVAYEAFITPGLLEEGFQVLCDLHNGFSGLGAKVTELLRDEYTGKGILTWGMTPILSVPNPQLSLYRLMNTVLGLVHLTGHSSLFCPLSLNGRLGLRMESPVAFPYVQYDASLDYHTSAILATALDTCTVPYRLQASTLSMTHLAEALNFSGRKVATAAAAVPFSVAPSQSLPDALCTHQSAIPWSPLSSCGDQRDSRCFAQSVVLRGIAKELQVSKPLPGCEPRSILHMCETGEEVLARYFYTMSPTTLSSTVHLLPGPCQLLAPYPQYFSPLLNKQGFLLDAPARTSANVESIPVITALQSSALLHRTLDTFYKDLHQLDVRRWASFFSAGVELDDFQEVLEELRTLSHCYRESDVEEESEDEVD